MAIKFWKSKNEFEQLEKSVRKAPSPLTYAELITQYQNAGEKEKALSVANQAMYYFPDSVEICDLYYRLKKKQVQPQIDSLKQVLANSPTPIAYAQLAEIYKDLRDQDTALSLCRESIAKFPQDDATYLVIGELRADRFLNDFQEKDGRQAIENLEKAREINPQNYEALLLLSKLYLQIGYVSKAIQRLKNIQMFSPADEEVEKLLQLATETKKPPDEDLYILLQNTQQQGKPYLSLGEDNKDSLTPLSDPEVFEKALDTLANVASIACLLVCDRDGNLVARHTKAGIDYTTYYEVAASIFQTIRESSRQMDIGQLQHGQIEGSFGVIHIVALQDVVYIAFGTQAVKPVPLYKELQNFIASVYSQRT